MANQAEIKDIEYPLFTRYEIALGTAGAVAAIDSLAGMLVPGRVTHPLVESEMVFRQTFDRLSVAMKVNQGRRPEPEDEE